MHSFEIEVIFVKHLLRHNCILVTLNDVLTMCIGPIYKIEQLLQCNNKVLVSPSSYTKMFGSDEHLIQFF